ncbi:MAG: hypothetical protein ACKVVT_13025 [Dehalococcoidia bacterium]
MATTPRIYAVAELRALPPPTPEEEAVGRAAILEAIRLRDLIRERYGALSDREFFALLSRDDPDDIDTSAK